MGHIWRFSVVRLWYNGPRLYHKEVAVMETRDAGLRVRLTESELGAVQIAARKSNQRVSDWVRAALAKAAAKARQAGE